MVRLNFFAVVLLVGITASPVRAQSAPEKPLPAKSPAESLEGPPHVTAKTWAVADGKTGKVLWGYQDAEPRPIASTTKIMTATIILKLAEDDAKVLDEVVVFSERAAETTGSSCKLKIGEQLPVKELLYGLLLPSGNDAAVALAEHFGPRFSVDGKTDDPVKRFVAEMNRRAGVLKLKETSFVDPNGLGRNLASARDMAALTWQAQKSEQFRDYTSTRRHSAEVKGQAGETRNVTWETTNRLLEMEGYDGVKTGSTTAAGSCLVASGTHGTDRLIVVVLGSTSNDGRYADARNLFRWAWQQRANKPNRSDK